MVFIPNLVSLGPKMKKRIHKLLFYTLLGEIQ
jgi:hypothetical protein